jgi:hypothetical protein
MGGQPGQVVYLSRLLGSLGAFHGGVVGLDQPILFHVVDLAKLLSLGQVPHANVINKGLVNEQKNEMRKYIGTFQQ